MLPIKAVSFNISFALTDTAKVRFPHVDNKRV